MATTPQQAQAAYVAFRQALYDLLNQACDLPNPNRPKIQAIIKMMNDAINAIEDIHSDFVQRAQDLGVI